MAKTVKRYAIVENGVVSNVTLWDGDTKEWQPPKGSTAVKCGNDVGIGWAYTGGEFAPPPAQEEE